MRKYLLVLLALFILSGCGRQQPAVETVTDDAGIPDMANEEYEILLFVPQEAAAYDSGEACSGRQFRHKEGDYRIDTRKLYADSAESAIRQITGKSAEEITVIQTQRFSLPEYRFAWYDDGENHRADLVCDGDQFYGIIFSWPEAVGNRYSDLMSQVFASFGISSSTQVISANE